MTALSNASRLLNELRKRTIAHEVLIVRDDALMISVAVPGERWEIEFFDDEHIEFERFTSPGVNDLPVTHEELVALLDQQVDPDEEESEE